MASLYPRVCCSTCPVLPLSADSMTVFSRPCPLPLSALLLLCLCAALALPSTLAIPIGGRRSSNSNERRVPHASNVMPPTPFAVSDPSSDAQSDLSPSDTTHPPSPSPRSHLYRNKPVPAVAHSLSTDAAQLSSDAADSPPPADSPALEADFIPGARAMDDTHHNHAPVPPPSRIRAQPQAGGLYAQQQPVSQVRTKHVHSDAESIPVADLDATPQAEQPPASPVSSSSAEPCLSAEQLSEAKKEVRERLLGVMEQYLAVWQAEEKTEQEIDQLYADKKEELKVKLADKKAQLTSRACAEGRRRRLLGLEDDDWFDQEEDKVYLIDESSSMASSVDGGAVLMDDDIVGAVARIVAGGRPLESSDSDDAPHFDASIHPYTPPSAFTSPSERDIQAIHSPAPTPQSKTQPASSAANHEGDGIGFIASISPARYSPAPLDSNPMQAMGQRSQRDMDEDLEEERRRRRERLKVIRARSSSNGHADESEQLLASHGSLPLTDEQLPAGGFVASISPMAPQRASLEDDMHDRADAFVASDSPAKANSAGRWQREEEEDEERKAEEGGGVWRSGSRGRLERSVGRS